MRRGSELIAFNAVIQFCPVQIAKTEIVKFVHRLHRKLLKSLTKIEKNLHGLVSNI